MVLEIKSQRTGPPYLITISANIASVPYKRELIDTP